MFHVSRSAFHNDTESFARESLKGRGARFFNQSRCFWRKSAGFTLIEILVVVSVIAILSTIGLATLFGRRNRAGLESATSQIAATLREAQNRSVARENLASWGVHLDNGTSTAPFYALFYNTYSTSTVLIRQIFSNFVGYATSSIASGASQEITFAQITGLPSASTSIILQLTGGGNAIIATSAISISSSGLISF